MIDAPCATQLTLSVLDCLVKIACRSPAALELLRLNFASMQQNTAAHANWEYSVGVNEERSEFTITRVGQQPLRAGNDAELVFLLEKDLTIELERQRRELYFIHAAALALAGAAVLLVAPSGTGKSTTAWGLLHHGFRYLSDELAPVDLETMRVFPYPHALCLKAEPPKAYPLPPDILRTARTLHVPTHRLPNVTVSEAVPLAAIFFLEYRPGEASTPDLEAISKGEAAARLFAQALNPLAHCEDGLRGAAAIACQLPGYRLRSADLGATCELLTRALSGQ
jgi:hypothetical protein